MGEAEPDVALWRSVWEASGPVEADVRRQWLHSRGARQEAAAPLSAPPADPGRYAWWCQERAAECAGEERREWLDRAIDAFETVVDSPLDLGNDEGPLWAVAGWLDRAQVTRAFALMAEMAPYPWPYRLGASRAALIGRLAALGELDAAWSRLEEFAVDDPFYPHWRAVALGAWLSAAATQGVDPAVGLSRVGFIELDEKHRYLLLDSVWHADGFAPRTEQARTWLQAAQSLEDPLARSLSVSYLAFAAWTALPAGEWIAAVSREREPIPRLLELADVGEDEPLRAAEALLRSAPDGAALGELLQHPSADLEVVEACARRWLADHPSRFDLSPDALRHWLARAGLPRAYPSR